MQAIWRSWKTQTWFYTARPQTKQKRLKKLISFHSQHPKAGKVLELTQDVHKKAWTRIKRAVEKRTAAEGPASPEATELPVAPRDSHGISRARLPPKLHWHRRWQASPLLQQCRLLWTGGWQLQQPWGYQPIPTVGAQNRLTSTGLCLPQGWQRHKADTRQQESLQQVQLNLPFKKADVFRKIF